MEKLSSYMAFVKAAQYLANVSADQDFRSELASVIFNFFAVDFAAVAERQPDGEMAFMECSKDRLAGEAIVALPAVRENVLDVLDSGLLKEEELPGPFGLTLFFVPIEIEKRTVAVLIIGHSDIERHEIANRLNEYLAVARLAGAIQSRIIYERESIKRKSNEKFRLLFDSSRDPILLLDTLGRIIECNEALIEMLGAASKQEVIGKSLAEFSPAYQPDGQRSPMKEERHIGEAAKAGNIQFEWVGYRSDSSEFTVDVKLSTVLMDGVSVRLVHWRDITERKRSEAQLKHLYSELERNMRELQDVNAALEEEILERETAQAALKQSRDELLDSEKQLKFYAAQLAAANEELAVTNSELRTFANIVAHDFRTPMVNLKGFSKELSDSVGELRQILAATIADLPPGARRQVDDIVDNEVPEALKFIDAAVDRLSRMIDSLLKLARLGRREITYTEIDMDSLVAGVVISYNRLIEQRGIALSIGALPRIQADQVAMEQIIGNLVDNAIKYLEPGRPGEISIDCTDLGDKYLFSVADNGRGIADADQEMIFELFRRAGSQDMPGEGMGLSYVRTLIRLLGGKVWPESKIGVGTRMNFTLPKRPDCEK